MTRIATIVVLLSFAHIREAAAVDESPLPQAWEYGAAMKAVAAQGSG